jgi:hypothetical protein
MKAFIAQNKYKSLRDEHDYLIVSSSKKEALNLFEQFIGGFEYSRYYKKDFKEVEIKEFSIYSMEIIPRNLENYALSDCFNFSIDIKLITYHPHAQLLISEDDRTTKELVKMFKQQHKEVLRELL